MNDRTQLAALGANLTQPRAAGSAHSQRTTAMADRTSAHLFGRIFAHLARTPDNPATRAFAAEMWGLMEDGGYDFSYYQMYADDDLEALGLSRMIETGDGPEREYGPA